MIREIIAKDGDTLEMLCWRTYGRESLVPLLLDANPHLFRERLELVAGTRIILPDVDMQDISKSSKAVQIVHLWD